MLLIIIGVIVAIITFIGIGSYNINNRDDEKPVCANNFLAVLVLAVFVFIACFKSVPTGHTGVVTTFGAVENYTFEAGIHFTNPFSRVITIDNRTQKETIELGAFSSDIQEVKVVYTVNYCIDKANAQNLYKTIGLSYFETIIKPKVTEDVKQIFAKYTAENLVASRTEVAMLIEKELKEDLLPYNIQLTATSIEDIDFTDAFTDAVEAKQVAEQKKLQAQTEAETKIINAEAEANVKLIEAEATAKANDLLTESLTADILQKQAIEKWNGQLPTVLSDGSNILDLTGLK